MVRGRIDSIILRIRRESVSDKGLHETGISKEAKREKELSKKNTAASIKELQDHVMRLEQEVEFLKKISHLDQQYKTERKPPTS